jgi:hypothetical protein
MYKTLASVIYITSQYHYTTMTFEHDKKNPPSLQHETMVPLTKEM